MLLLYGPRSGPTPTVRSKVWTFGSEARRTRRPLGSVSARYLRRPYAEPYYKVLGWRIYNIYMYVYDIFMYIYIYIYTCMYMYLCILYPYVYIHVCIYIIELQTLGSEARRTRRPFGSVRARYLRRSSIDVST